MVPIDRNIKEIAPGEYEAKYFSKKTSKYVEAPILPETVALLEKWEYRFNRIDLSNTNQKLKKIARIAGLTETTELIQNNQPVRVPVWRKISTHAGRRYFAQLLNASEVSDYTIQQVVGHSAVKMTREHYIQFDPARGKNEVRKALKASLTKT